MSRTLAEAERTVRYHLRDRNPQSEAFTSPEYVLELQSGVRLLAGELLLGETETLALITTAANTKDYVLSGTQQYANLYELRDQEDGLIIPIVSMAVLEAWREGDTGTVGHTGSSQIAAIFETTAQATTVRFYPTPTEVRTLDGRFSRIPASFYTAGTGILAALPDSTTIPYDDQGFEALCFRVAKSLFDRMPEDQRARRGLAPTAADEWGSLSASLVKHSRHRMIRLGRGQSTHVNRARRW